MSTHPRLARAAAVRAGAPRGRVAGGRPPLGDPAAARPAGPVTKTRQRPIERVSFHAMGTTVTIRAVGAPRLAREVRRLEGILTRFGGGVVARLNREGRLQDPPPELVAALAWAVEASRLTGGLVTPLVGRSLEWHGYATSWHEGARWIAPEGTPPAVPSVDELVVSAREIVLPPGAAIDLGGTGKSWLVERVAGRATEVVIDAGGDVLVRSAAASEVDVLGAAEGWHLRLPPGAWAVATSSLARRAWRGGHHLIDPRTGRPAQGRWVQATVVGRSLMRAELATKLLLLGAPVPETLQVEQAWVVDRDGTLH